MRFHKERSAEWKEWQLLLKSLKEDNSAEASGSSRVLLQRKTNAEGRSGRCPGAGKDSPGVGPCLA